MFGQLEQLETRQMLSASLSAGVLSIVGTAGNDTLLVNPGKPGEIIVTENGSPTGTFLSADVTKIKVTADSGNDLVTINVFEASEIRGGAGNDVLQGGNLGDKIYGEAGADLLKGFGGNDSLYAGDGNDTVFGGTGDDYIEGGAGSDYLYGDSGNDTIYGENFSLFRVVPNLAINISLRQRTHPNFHIPILAIKNLNLKVMPIARSLKLDPKIISTVIDPIIIVPIVTYNDVIAGGTGNDKLHGNTGNDTVFGHEGNDSCWGDAGDDQLFGAQGKDELFAGAGNDELYGGDDADTLIAVGGGLNDQLRGESGLDQIWCDSLFTDDVFDGTAVIHRVGSFVGGVSKELNGQNLTDPNATFNGYTPDYANFSSKPLFNTSGPSKNDIDQGSVGDCYFLAGLSGIAKQNAQRIRNNIVSFGDGTYGVRFFAGGVEKFYRVDGDLPVNVNTTTPRYADLGTGDSLWVALMEKAFAFFRSGANSYASLHGGGLNEPFAALNAGAAQNLWAGTQNATLLNIRAALLAGKAVSAGTPTGAPTNGCPCVGWHAYMVESVQVNGAGTPISITLRNPWGVDGAGSDGVNDGYVTATAAQFYGYFTSARGFVV